MADGCESGTSPPSGPPPSAAPREAEETAARVRDQLKTCYDPEIPVDIVELGLIYETRLDPHPQGGFRVSIRMTLTAPGCPLAPALEAEVRRKVLGIPGVRECDLQFVWDPPWDPSRMSDAAKLRLGFL